MASETGEKTGEINAEARERDVDEKGEWLAVPSACEIRTQKGCQGVFKGGIQAEKSEYKNQGWGE